MLVVDFSHSRFPIFGLWKSSSSAVCQQTGARHVDADLHCTALLYTSHCSHLHCTAVQGGATIVQSSSSVQFASVVQRRGWCTGAVLCNALQLCQTL